MLEVIRIWVTIIELKSFNSRIAPRHGSLIAVECISHTPMLQWLALQRSGAI